MNTLIELIKDKKVVANYLMYDVSLCEILNILIDIVKNYNENLAGTFLEPELFGLSFFDKKDMFGNSRHIVSPIIEPSSRKHVLEKYPNFNITPVEKTSDENGVIGLTNWDITSLEDTADQTIVINPDKAMVFLYDCLREYDLADCLKMKIDETSLPTCDLNLGRLRFNELEDARDFIKDNASGWIKEDGTDKVVMLREKYEDWRKHLW